MMGSTRSSPARSGVDSGLVRLLATQRVVVLTGAGCSTESGIPDYRGPNGTRRTATPMLHQEFVGDADARARYWMRSAAGWPRFSEARPNPAHAAIARLEHSGFVRGVITQNVDGLHQAAGSRRVLELHGSLSRVRCLGCGGVEERASVQSRLHALNPGGVTEAAEIAPDGDARVGPGVGKRFRVPDCRPCGGVLMPDVVFFGANVPKERLEQAWDLFESGDALLVVGSSLTVYSGRRFVLKAVERGRPVAIVNLGPTRGDEVAELKVEGRVGEVLPRLADALEARGPGPAVEG